MAAVGTGNGTESLIVFSDVHLGSDLNDSGDTYPRSTAIDADLAALLHHYKEEVPPAGRWHLVIAGDFVDFVGMAIDARPEDPLETPPSPLEKKFGLGGAEDHVRLKLRRAAERHPDVFDGMRAFVAAGHAITMVLGNHDLELHWESVREDFRALLAETPEERARIQYCEWFFHRPDFVFVEHGHQYDPFCSTATIMAPLCPADASRVRCSLSDSLLRHIVRRTPGMKEYGHETRGLASYISWGLMLGARGTAGLFHRFFEVVFHLRDVARAYDGPGGEAVRAAHERKLRALAEDSALPLERLRAALDLHLEPLGATPRGVLASVMLDRFATACVMVVLLAVVAWQWAHLGGAAPLLLAALLLLWGVLHLTFSRARPAVDPAAVMVDRAEALAKLFPSSFVVMGHTHVPASEAISESIYINVGSWAEEEPDPKEDPAKAYRAARTHLVAHRFEDRHEARLCEWQSGVGPRERTALIRPLRQPVPQNPVDAPVAPVAAG